VLFGEHNPSGKLPFSWPSSAGQIRNVVDHRPPSNGTGDPGPNEPLFAFGHGLSYTAFDYGNLSASASGADAGGAVEVSVDVTNDGDVAGTEVVHAYVTRAYGSVIHPDERLIGFDRVSLDPGETRTVTVETPLSVLAVVPGDVPGNGERVVEPGEYEVTVGGRTDTFTVGERDE
jgi:beta-glucosidase